MSILPNGSINTETIKCTSKFLNYNYNTESFFNNNNTNKYAFSTKEVSSKAVERLAYKDYYNGRYGFSIKYPSNLIIGTESDNGDGITLSDETGSTKLIVYGSNNVLDATAKSAYIDTLKEIPKVLYKKQSGNWYVVSWTHNNKIIYKKEVVGKGSINTLIFTYSSSQKELYDEFLQNLKSYFKTPGISEVH